MLTITWLNDALIFDVLRTAHMLLFGLGIGTAVFLEVHLFRLKNKLLYRADVALIFQAHGLIKLALAGLWATGLGLLYMRLAVYDGTLTPKLMAKLGIVGLLTLNMLLISKVVLPEIVRLESYRLSDLPAVTAVKFGAIAGISAACWLIALALGGIGAFLSMDAAMLITLLTPPVLAAALIGAMVAWLKTRSVA